MSDHLGVEALSSLLDGEDGEDAEGRGQDGGDVRSDGARSDGRSRAASHLAGCAQCQASAERLAAAARAVAELPPAPPGAAHLAVGKALEEWRPLPAPAHDAHDVPGRAVSLLPPGDGPGEPSGGGERGARGHRRGRRPTPGWRRSGRNPAPAIASAVAAAAVVAAVVVGLSARHSPTAKSSASAAAGPASTAAAAAPSAAEAVPSLGDVSGPGQLADRLDHLAGGLASGTLPEASTVAGGAAVAAPAAPAEPASASLGNALGARCDVAVSAAASATGAPVLGTPTVVASLTWRGIPAVAYLAHPAGVAGAPSETSTAGGSAAPGAGVAVVVAAGGCQILDATRL